MFITNYLATAAFLLVKGCELNNLYINSKKVYVFEFNGDEEKIRKIAIKYINSECAVFDSQIKNLKKMLNPGYI